MEWIAPKLVDLNSRDALRRRISYGLCISPGSGDSGSCANPGNSADLACMSTGNSDATRCDSGNSPG